MNIKEQVLAYKEDMLNDLKELVKYNSVEDLTNSAYPFGEQNAKCLNEALRIMENKGLKVTNLDNYCGFGEVGEGDKLIGVLGHLDVVPAGEGWDTDPFTLTIKGNKAYGRGSTDDKGPLVASLYAIKILLDNNVKLNKRIRLICGCNEETGSRCLAHYVEKEGHIDYGFTPDANFPGIYGEKGMVASVCKAKSSKILDIKGGVAKNVVMAKVRAEVVNGSFDIEKFGNYLRENGLKYEISVEDTTKILVEGVAAHASLPELGKNALSYLVEALYQSGMKDEFVDYYHRLIGLSTNGSNAKINLKDEYGELTFNVGLVYYKDGEIYFTIDIRYPVTKHHDMIILKMNEEFNEGGSIVEIKGAKPLFYPPNSPMIEALYSAYQQVSGDYESQLEVIGGGTYSKGINNCIAFGGEFQGQDCHIHDANEFIDIDGMMLQCEIFVQALMNLLAI